MTKNMITALISIIIGCIYLIATLNLKQVHMGDPLGPKVFPLLVGGILTLLGLFLAIKEIFIPKTPKKLVSFDLSKDGKKVLLLIGLSSVFGILYGFILDSLGYLISTALFMIFLMFFVNKPSRWVENIIVAIGFSLVTYIGFATLLHLSLPRGILNF